MNTVLDSEIAKLSDAQKLDLIGRLWREVEPAGPATGILGEDDPALEAVLERRLTEVKADRTQRMTLGEFKASFGDK